MSVVRSICVFHMSCGREELWRPSFLVNRFGYHCNARCVLWVRREKEHNMRFRERPYRRTGQLLDQLIDDSRNKSWALAARELLVDECGSAATIVVVELIQE